MDKLDVHAIEKWMADERCRQRDIIIDGLFNLIPQDKPFFFKFPEETAAKQEPSPQEEQPGPAPDKSIEDLTKSDSDE